MTCLDLYSQVSTNRLYLPIHVSVFVKSSNTAQVQIALIDEKTSPPHDLLSIRYNHPAALRRSSCQIRGASEEYLLILPLLPSLQTSCLRAQHDRSDKYIFSEALLPYPIVDYVYVRVRLSFRR